MKQALLVIDCIKGIVETGTCAAYLAENKQVIPNINKLIDLAKQNEILVIHIRLAFTSLYEGLPKHAPVANLIRDNHKFLLGTAETAFISTIHMAEKDNVINKKYGNPFYQSELLELLQKNNIESLIFTGMATDNAIIYGAEEAMCNGFYVLVVTDACGASTAEAHENALAMMKQRTVNEFLTTKELIDKFLKKVKP